MRNQPRDANGRFVQIYFDGLTYKQRKKYQDLEKKYGITIEKYNEMLTLQSSGCTICNKHITENGRFFAVDHNHKNGNIRDLLCNQCNSGLGFFNDDPERILRAYLYLIKHKRLSEKN